MHFSNENTSACSPTHKYDIELIFFNRKTSFIEIYLEGIDLVSKRNVNDLSQNAFMSWRDQKVLFQQFDKSHDL